MGEVIVQKLFRKDKTNLELAINYFSLISILFSLGLRRREIELLAFTATRGTITPVSAKDEFIRIFGSSRTSIENMKGILKRKGLLVKVEGKYRVHPSLALDFSKDLVLQMNLSHEENNPGE